VITFETIALAFCVGLFLILGIGSMRLKIPRKVSFQGIDDSKAAEEYDRMSRTPQFKLIRRNFVKKLKKYNVEGTIVDVGCGPGYLLELIAKEYPAITLVGVDISKEMTERAKTNLESLGLRERAEFKQGPADHLPFEDRTQDFVVSTFSLHHWSDPKLAFNEIHRVLKPGGQMLTLDLRRDARQMFLWLMWFAQNVAFRIIGLNALRRINEPIGSLLASYTLQEIIEMMSKSDFSNWQIEAKLGWIYLYGKKTLEAGDAWRIEKKKSDWLHKS